MRITMWIKRYKTFRVLGEDLAQNIFILFRGEVKGVCSNWSTSSNEIFYSYYELKWIDRENSNLLQIFYDWNLCWWIKKPVTYWIDSINWSYPRTILFFNFYYVYIVFNLWFWAHSTWSTSKAVAMETNSLTYIKIVFNWFGIS